MFDDITTLISTVGFPIAAAVALFYLLFNLVTEVKSMVEKTTETNTQIAATLKEVMNQITEIRIQLERLEMKVEQKDDEDAPRN